MKSGELTPSDYVDILKRRKWSLILPVFLVFVPAVIIAIMLPSVYKSTSTILIEEQDIPADFVMATVTGYADQRIQAINQRIMSSSRLLEIINRFNLYKHLKGKKTVDEIVGQMKEDVSLEPISADVVDRRTGRSMAAMIAFNLSYEGKDEPRVIADVANTLSSLFLEENLKVRQRQTEETSQFLDDELGKLRVALNEVEKQIGDFKEQHINELPELLNVNQQGYYGIEREIGTLNDQLRSLEERHSSLKVQVASVEPHLEQKDEDRLRLIQLKQQLANLQSRVSDRYPDVVKLKAEIAQIEKQMADNRLSESAPPDNPAYISLQAELSSINAGVSSIKRQISSLHERKRQYLQRIEATPKVEEEYKQLLYKRNNLQAKHDDLTRKLMEARVAQGLEKEQKGERFTLIDPARVPEKPYKPNRLAISLLGLILGIGAGVAVAALLEYLDDSIRTVEGLSRTTGLPVLAIVPEIQAPQDILRKRITVAIVIIVLLALVGLSILAFHYFVMDLNVFWAKLMRKASGMM